ncbi:MAG TPA: hypothetical protein VFF48_02785 [Brevundimonas sp.]|nr:hypothetical protein [Brevundimonas sp.]
MRTAFLGRGLSLAAIAAAAVLSGCASGEAEAEAEARAMAAAADAAARARTPVPINLNEGVAESAAVYLAFTRDIAATRGGFDSPEAVQAALVRGAAYDPAQVSRGLVSYASILALQSPEFVAGVNQYSLDPAVRQRVIAEIVRDPGYASTLPGADVAAGLIMSALNREIDALAAAADSIENDAYAAQADGRRSWAIAHVIGREARLENAKSLSGQPMLPSADESARLFAAANRGSGLGVAGGRPRSGPYPPAVTNALALAALAALGAAGNDARANTEALQSEPVSANCLNESKLNLYQCLAASRPSYEDMFCVGRHIVRDLGTCARGAALPRAVITVSNPVSTAPARPEMIVTPPAPPPSMPAPVQPRLSPVPATPTNSPSPIRPPAPAVTPATPPAATMTPTQRLNTAPSTPPRS